MRKWLPIWVLLALTPVCAMAEDVPTEHKFSAKVSAVRLATKLVDQGMKLNETVTARVPAIVFDKVLVIDDVRDAEETRFPEINRLIDYQKALICGSPDDILSFWHPGERRNKAKTIKDDNRLKAVRNHYTAHPGLEILGIVYQEATASVLVYMGRYVVGHTFRKEGGEFYLSDAPSDDLQLAIVEASFSRLPTE